MKKKAHTSQEIQKIWKEAYPKLSESVPESIFKLPREEMIEKARIIINNHFLKNYQNHNEIMADKTTGSAMIGFMMCWNWMKSE